MVRSKWIRQRHSKSGYFQHTDQSVRYLQRYGNFCCRVRRYRQRQRNSQPGSGRYSHRNTKPGVFRRYA